MNIFRAGYFSWRGIINNKYVDDARWDRQVDQRV